jgi:hypothetical protein
MQQGLSKQARILREILDELYPDQEIIVINEDMLLAEMAKRGAFDNFTFVYGGSK